MASKLLPDFVYGGIDGIITTFVVVAGTIGANLHYSVLLILGLSNVLADGFSIASSKYLSAKTEEEVTNDGHPRDPSPLTSAIVTFVSFALMGMIPLSAFVVGHLLGKKDQYYWIGYISTIIALFLVGYVKGYVKETNGDTPKNQALISGLETLFVGGMASLVSFGVGRTLQHLHPR